MILVHTPGSPMHRLSLQTHPGWGQSVGQSSVPPHPSPTLPQYRPPPAVSQVAGVHAGGPPTHTESTHFHPAGQSAPQSSVPPQPSLIFPQ